jgi:N-formylglutamate deformylase
VQAFFVGYSLGMISIFNLHQGTSPLLVSVPHTGTYIPPELRSLFTAKALEVEDTDWHLDVLYDYVKTQNASLLVPQHSRYMIDLNRPPNGAAMYPEANNTGLCPVTDFYGDSIYLPGCAPDAQQMAQRTAQYWQPYHAALASELARIKALHGYAVLLDGHSIKSQVPWLFEGRLPDLNIGTANGASCAANLREAVAQLLAGQSEFSHVMDGRFTGGYITRHYGRPGEGVHAVQLEMCWSTYMQESPPYVLDAQRHARVHQLLQALTTLLAVVVPRSER